MRSLLRQRVHPTNVWDTLDRIRSTLGSSEGEFAEMLRLTRPHYLKMRSRLDPPKLFQVEQLIDELGLDFELFITGKIDYAAIAARHRGDALFIPERYSIGAFSRKRTSLNLLGYLETHHGWRWKDRVLRHFQVTEAAFQNPDEMINIHFISDLTEYLVELGFTPRHLIEMGKFSVTMNRWSIGQLLRDCKTPGAVYEKVIQEMIHLYDRNFRYKIIRRNDETCSIVANPREQVCDLLKISRPGNEYTCLAKMGGFASIPAYLGFPHAEVSETTCIHRGDSECQYHVRFPTIPRHIH